MPNVADFSDIVDINRIRRAREMSDLKSKVAAFGEDPFELASKTVILFTYAHWEGFYNECVEAYVSALIKLDVEATQTSWLMLLGNLEQDFMSLSSRNHSYEAKIDFIISLQGKMGGKFEKFDKTCLLARSNLNFEKLRTNLKIIGCNIESFNKLRNRLDKELVAWRHSIAHGSSPELSHFGADRHIALASDLMLTLSDVFQDKILAIQS